MSHIYIFDYSQSKLYHDLIEDDKDYLEYYTEHGFKESQCNCMITKEAIYIEDISDGKEI